MSRSKALPRKLVGNFARLTSFLTRNRKREPFARCLHQPFCQNFWVTNSAIALGNTLCGYKATPYSALSCFSLFRQLKAFIGVAKAAMEKKKNPLFWEDCQNPFGQAGGESLPHSSNPAWQLACLLVSFSAVASSSLLFLRSLRSSGSPVGRPYATNPRWCNL